MKSNMVGASSLRTKDTIEVPVEQCVIIKSEKVPGQLKNRGNYLIQLTVVPVSGPWANCEGTFIVESSDLVPLVKRYSNKQRRRESFYKFLCSLRDKVFGPKVEEVPKLTGPMT